MVQVERHKTIERAQNNPRDNTAINSQTRLAQPQHRPDVGRFLMLTFLVNDTRKEQRQDRRQHHTGYPWQHAHQVRWQFADHQLSQHGAHIVNHHIGCQQAPAVT